MKVLLFLDILAELIQLVFELGAYTRKYAVPAVVYAYVVVEKYIAPAALIPMYYLQVRRERLSMVATG